MAFARPLPATRGTTGEVVSRPARHRVGWTDILRVSVRGAFALTIVSVGNRHTRWRQGTVTHRLPPP